MAAAAAAAVAAVAAAAAEEEEEEEEAEEEAVPVAAGPLSLLLRLRRHVALSDGSAGSEPEPESQAAPKLFSRPGPARARLFYSLIFI